MASRPKTSSHCVAMAYMDESDRQPFHLEMPPCILEAWAATEAAPP
jgi:hypothetical protein